MAKSLHHSDIEIETINQEEPSDHVQFLITQSKNNEEEDDDDQTQAQDIPTKGKTHEKTQPNKLRNKQTNNNNKFYSKCPIVFMMFI